MSRQDTFERLLATLHEATLDDSHWPAASELIDEVCGTRGNALVLGTGRSQEDSQILFARFCYRGQRHEERERWYFDNFFRLDERIPRLVPLPDGRVVPIPSLYTPRELKTLAAYNEALPRGGFQNGLNVRLDGPGGSHIVWTLADCVERGGWRSAQLETIESLLPHIRQFVRTRAVLVNANLHTVALGNMLGSAAIGVVQLSREGRIREANDCARDILQGNRGLSDEGGFLRAKLHKDDANLKRVLADALPISEDPPRGGSLTVERPPDLPPLMVHVHPVSADWAGFGAAHSGALVMIVSPQDQLAIDPYAVAATLGLTLSEGRIAARLAEGQSVREVAHALGRPEYAVRWVLRRIFRKQGITRQAELVRLVLQASFEAQPP